MEEEISPQPEEKKPYTRQDLVDVIDRLKKELKETGRKPTEMEAYGIKHALYHYDQAHPDEAPRVEEKSAGE